MAILLVVISNVLQFAGPLLMKEIIIYLNDEDDNEYSSSDAYLFAAGIFLSYLLRSLLQCHGIHLFNRISFKSLNLIQSTLFNKILGLSQSQMKYLDEGKVSNFTTGDALKIYSFWQYSQYIFAAPIMVVVAIVLIFLEIGWLGIVGIVMIFVSIFCNAIIGKITASLRKQQMSLQDERGKLLAELLKGIKIIKYSGWENIIQQRITKIRDKEASTIFKYRISVLCEELIMALFPALIATVTFQAYTATGEELTTSKALATLGYFNLLFLPLKAVGFSLNAFVMIYTSLRRLLYFSLWEEKQVKNFQTTQSKYAVEIEQGIFCWESENAKYQHNLLSSKIGKTTKEEKANLELKSKELKERSDFENNQQNIIFDNLNLKINKGEFVTIIGKVGQGKSSLVLAILNEMYQISGDLKVNGKIAYTSQTPWLLNETLKNNILFGERYDQKKYQEIIKICQLEEDIQLLQDADNTEIGERGINLSGGQKQRVCLARSLYQEADIYIFDDILSALDTQVGQKIYNDVILNKLQNKTRIMITHQIDHTHKSDNIIVIESFKIIEQDTYQNLSNIKDSLFNKLSLEILTKQQQQDSKKLEEQEKANLQNNTDIINDDDSILLENQVQIEKFQDIQEEKESDDDNNIQSPDALQNEKLEQKKSTIGKIEKKQDGSISWKVFTRYFSTCGICLSIILIFTQFFQICSFTAVELMVGFWSIDEFDWRNRNYIFVLYGVAIFIIIIVLIKNIVFATMNKNFAQISKTLLHTLLRNKLNWFDNKASGSIINRLIKDQDDADIQLPSTLQWTLYNSFIILGYFLLAAVIQPIFIAYMIVIAIVFIYIGKKYLCSARELKRVEALARGPTLTHFSELYNGQLIIRSFRKKEMFLNILKNRFNLFIQANSCNNLSQIWINLRSFIIIAFTIGFVAFFGVLSKDFNYISDGSLIGVSILAILKIQDQMFYLIQMYGNFEQDMSSVERLFEYLVGHDQEKEWDQPIVAANWPIKGKIEIQNLYLRYSKNLPLIIKNLSVEIEAAQKIGVIGRTGSGKSTITLGLLRILECDNKSFNEKQNIQGKIIIDGVNIYDIGLHYVRQNITIIPQDPFLFTGTLRDNIDPFKEYSDKEIITALQKVHIFEHLKDLTDEEMQQVLKKYQIDISKFSTENQRLYKLLEEDDKTFSQGQKQLLCMARALIRKSKILIMDEATSSIDLYTDNLIQDMIQKELVDITVFTIAHRLNTICNYDKILVLDQGELAEFDTPQILIQNQESYFYKLVQNKGEHYYHQILQKIIENSKLKN